MQISSEVAVTTSGSEDNKACDLTITVVMLTSKLLYLQLNLLRVVLSHSG